MRSQSRAPSDVIIKAVPQVRREDPEQRMICWHCRGKYHTSGACSNPEEKPVAGSHSPLELEAATTECALHCKAAHAAGPLIDEATHALAHAAAEARIEALRLLQRVRWRVGHTHVLTFFMSAGLLRHRLEHACAHMTASVAALELHLAALDPLAPSPTAEAQLMASAAVLQAER